MHERMDRFGDHFSRLRFENRSSDRASPVFTFLAVRRVHEPFAAVHVSVDGTQF